jgi:hypothetical protein|tara:strand:- start:86 stop:256 length:171 start_codon:yes stop_codon:yes gene_type:complete
MATSILEDGRFDQQALAAVYAQAYAVNVEKENGFPLTRAREAVLDFAQLLAERQDS